MAFSIQTNVNALIAQENLRVNSEFQSRTIQRLTSGFRINQSGDDAAGLAIANKFRTDTAELTQGVRNANDGVSQLQIIDGGMNNISKMLDRLKTLATQSASDTFTGDRKVLNAEYQSLVGEINRQAQSIGLSDGGRFASKINVYIGGGVTVSGESDATNGTVSVDLASAAVDAKSLGLTASSYKATSAAGSDISAGGTTSLANIVNTAANQTNGKATATFNFYGPEFSTSGSGALSVSVDLTGVSDTSVMVTKINDAIVAAGNAGGTQAGAFKDANIRASLSTDSAGRTQLAFSSTDSAFQVLAGSKTASALMGHFKANSTSAAEGADVTPSLTGPAAANVGGTTTSAKIRLVYGDGTVSSWGAVTNVAGADDIDGIVTKVTAAVTAIETADSVTTGISVSHDANNKLVFTGKAGQSFEVQVSSDTSNTLGLGNWGAESNTFTGAADPTVGASGDYETLAFSINGGDAVAVKIDGGLANATAIRDALNDAFDANATLKSAGMVASITGTGELKIDSGLAGTKFRVSIQAVSGTIDLGITADDNAATAVTSKGTLVGVPGVTTSGSSNASATEVFDFKGLRNTGGTANANADSQQVIFSTTDSDNTVHSVSVSLDYTNAKSLDAAINQINTSLQNSNDSQLQKIVAVKELNSAGTAEGIRFVSSLTQFSVNVGAANNTDGQYAVGVYQDAGGTPTQGKGYTSSKGAALSATDISTASGGSSAISVLSAAVSKLGTAQAAVGKGQNQLGYAIALAQSQISSYSAAESRIRDADVAQEAANLTKAQVLQQASMAAMAQANSAPQAVLALLRG